MKHKHSVYDTDAHFSINPFTRAIKNESASKVAVIQHDHNSERFTFEIPRLVDGHDMSVCDRVEVHYINMDSTNPENVSADIYEVDDLQVSPDDSGFVVCSWLLSQNATKYAGSLNFLVRFVCLDGEKIAYAWHTAIFTGISVSSGILNNAEEIIEPHVDVLAQWKADLFGVGDTEEQRLLTVSAEQQAAIAAKGAAVLDSIPDEYEALQAQADENTRIKAGAIVLDAEGESIVVNDASDFPMMGLKVFGKSTQDGTPTPDAPVDIVSVEKPVVGVYGKNLLPDVATNEAYSGVTIVVNEDGSLTINGTATATVYYAPFRFTFKKGVSYIMSGCPSGGSASTYFMYINNLGGVRDYGNGVEVNLQDDFTSDVGFCIHAGTTINNLTFKPMVRLSESPEGYEAHSKQNITVPHTLPGIPVSSGGNYNDADGQQWICDEVDLKRGVYIQRIKEFVLSELNADTWYTWGVSHTTEGITGFYHYFTDSVLIDFVLCNIGVFGSKTWGGLSVGVGASANSKYLTISVDNSNLADVSTNEKAIESLKTLIANTNAKMYAVIEPIETPLSDAEINAFKALHSNKPNTTILNDAGAFMAVEYVADTKTYIDNKIKELMEGVTE